jgi:hypothetical protein
VVSILFSDTTGSDQKEIVAATNRKLQTDLPNLTEQKETLEKDLSDVIRTADDMMDQWDSLAGEDGAVFLKERLDELGKRRTDIERALEELEIAIDDVEREAVDQEAVLEALASFGDVFDCIPPFQQKELFRLVIHKVIVSEGSMELALYGKPPELGQMTQGTARSQTSNWLPGSNPLHNLSLFFRRVGNE